MRKRDDLINGLKQKLDLSLQYGKALDEQFSALGKDDPRRLAKNINLMDECQAKLLDVDHSLADNNSNESIKWPLLNPSQESIGPEIRMLMTCLTEAMEGNISKIKRNRESVLSKQGEISKQMKDLSKSASIKNYFGKSNTGEFLNFSG